MSICIFAAMFIGFVASFIVAISQLGKTKPVKQDTNIKQDFKEKSLKIRNSKDLFLYTILTKSAKSQK